MNKVIKLNELDLVNLVGQVLSEVKKDEDFSEFSPEYHYVSIGILPNKFKSDEMGPFSIKVTTNQVNMVEMLYSWDRWVNLGLMKK